MEGLMAQEVEMEHAVYAAEAVSRPGPLKGFFDGSFRRKGRRSQVVLFIEGQEIKGPGISFLRQLLEERIGLFHLIGLK